MRSRISRLEKRAVRVVDPMAYVRTLTDEQLDKMLDNPTGRWLATLTDEQLEEIVKNGKF